MLDALLFLRQFVMAGKKAEELFPLSQRTRWLDRAEQTLEIEAMLGTRNYKYQLVIKPWGDPPLPLVASETIHIDNERIVEFRIVRFRFLIMVTSSSSTLLDPSRTALSTAPTSDTTTLIRPFKQWLGSLYSFRLDPFAMGLEAKGENPIQRQSFECRSLVSASAPNPPAREQSLPRVVARGVRRLQRSSI